MLPQKALFALFFAVLALASPTAHPGHVLHEKREAPLKRWVKHSDVDADIILPMRIGMVQPNIHKGHDLLMAASDPDSPTYGQWYTEDEVIDLFAPEKHAIDAVRLWLESSGIESHKISQSTNKQWIQFDVTTAQAEELLKTKYHYYEHINSGHKNIACDEYHLPKHVAQHVDYVTPGLRLLKAGMVERGLQQRKVRGPQTPFPMPSGVHPQTQPADDPSLLALCNLAVTPTCISSSYGIPNGTKKAKGNELGIFESLNDYLNLADLKQFLTEFQSGRIPPNTQPIFEGIDGARENQTVAGPESGLDFQISYPIIYPQNSILFQTDDYNYQNLETTTNLGFLNTFLDALDGSYCTSSAYGETGNSPIDPVYPDTDGVGPDYYQGQLQCGKYKPTNVISVSYGAQEDDLPSPYQMRQCQEFLKLGLQGTSVLIASGDSGVAGPPTDDNNDDGCLGNGEVFNPDFPATCPYLTAVGATLLTNAQPRTEVAVTRFPSGGGFSNIYPRPSYQDAAVTGYLQFEAKNTSYKSYALTQPNNNPDETLTKGGLFNRAGRGYPDVSSIGDNVVNVLDGRTIRIGGTSASAPTWAAILTRINEERLACGKKTVGFVNPVLYKNPGAFNDITVGNNSGCGTSGFYATKGWDPLTGLGTPNYPALLKVFQNLK